MIPPSATTRHAIAALACGLWIGSAVSQTPREAPEPVLKEIQAALQTGDAPAVKTRLDQALKKFPNDPVLHNFSGVLAAQQGRYGEAEAAFRKAIQLAPGYAGAYLNLGRLYQEHAAADESAGRKGIQTYESLLRLDPENAEANYQLATLLVREGDHARARLHLQRLPEDLQARVQALALRCVTEAAAGDRAKAEQLVGTLLEAPDLTEADVLSAAPALVKLKREDLAARLLEGLAARRLASAESLRQLAILHEAGGRLAEARRTFDEAAKAGGTVTTPMLLDLARVAYKQKDWEGALGYLAHARDLEPANAGIHFFFGVVAIEMDLPVEAEKSLREAVKLDPQQPYYNYALGAVIAGSRKWKEAVPYFDKYCAAKPDDPRGKLALASAHFHSFEADLARKELLEVIARPETASGAHYYLGLLALQENDFAGAIKELEQSVQLSPEFAEAYAELGFAYMQQEELDKARRALERSIELEPEGRRANLILLSLYQRAEDPRADAQAKRYEELDKKLTERTKLLLRTIEARPY